MKVCVIMQGVPGSGKSFVASLIAKATGAIIHSTDNYFMVDGEYKFDGTKLSEYHNKNLIAAIASMEKAENVIIDNTNIFQQHVNLYIKEARQRGYHIQFIRVTGDNFGNTHGVLEEVIQRMKDNMENLNA